MDITPGEDNTFILDSENKYDASAAVFVTMRDGAELDPKQVQGIRNFVSHSVQGLEIDNVTITDSYGNTYSAGDTFTDIQDLSALKLQLEEQIDKKIRTGACCRCLHRFTVRKVLQESQRQQHCGSGPQLYGLHRLQSGGLGQ